MIFSDTVFGRILSVFDFRWEEPWDDSGKVHCLNVEAELLKLIVVVYYQSRKRELKTRPIYECRCDERLKTSLLQSETT
jgi:hypothetical protein